jgi:hypothetical protein
MNPDNLTAVYNQNPTIQSMYTLPEYLSLFGQGSYTPIQPTPTDIPSIINQNLNQGGGDGGGDDDNVIDTKNNAGIDSLSDVYGAIKGNLNPGSLLGLFNPFAGIIGSYAYGKMQEKKAEAARVAAVEAVAQRTRDTEQAARERDQAARARALNPEVYANRQENDGRSSFGKQTDEEAAYGSCFIAGTKVTMADGTFKNIEDIKVGDKVKGHKGNNEVIKLDPTLLGERKLYSFNDNEHYFFTSEHPFMTEEGWKSIKPEKTKERDGVELYNQLKGELKVGDKLVTDNGSIEITDIKSKEMNSPKMPLYNFNISNDNSYIADNYIVHNKGGSGGGIGGMGAGMCFDPSTPIQMADGSTKEIKDIQLGDDTKGGEVTGVFQFKAADEIHDYKGVTVAGSHFVKEDGKFIMVKDSPLSVKIDRIPVVYSLDTTARRIFINDIEFADYNGDGVAKNFLNNAGVDLTGFDKEVLRQVEHRLI